MPVLRTLAVRLRIRFLEISRAYGPQNCGMPIGTVLEFPNGIGAKLTSAQDAQGTHRSVQTASHLHVLRTPVM